ncbi:MAG: exo 1,3/1,4-beta-D-glucan glucohydrolase [Pseudomonadota bacterium]|nr:exo 1,3/1,4-beta-D-glucan glucohydrolase [Pseudomonadota bacterium]
MTELTRKVSARRSRLALSGLATLSLVGCVTAVVERDAFRQGAPGAHYTQIDPAKWPQAKSPVPYDEDLERRVKDIVSRMTLEEKAGQVIQADINSVTPDDVRKYHLGSVLNGGNSGPHGENRAAPKEWLKLADAFYFASVDTSDGGAGVPVIWGTDAVHGHSNIVGATLFPHNIGLGAANDPDLIRRIGEATAEEVAATGIDWTFAPTLAVVRDDRWGRTYEGYAESPDIVAAYGSAIVEGLQGKPGTDDFLGPKRVIASAKHFIGDGGTNLGIDQGNNLANEDDLAAIHGAGYVTAINAGVQTVMASFSSWQGVKMHANKALLTDVLIGRMGFDGFVVGDWNAHGQIEGCTNSSCAAAFNAGVDMFMSPDDWRELHANMLRDVRDGAISMKRLDDAVTRILRVKFRAGLFEAGPPSKRPGAGNFATIGSPEHRALAREAVRKSLVLLKNNNGVLPIDPSSTILVAGDGADNIGKQAGGWTITWQGDTNGKADFPGGQSIYDGVRKAAKAAGGRAILSVDGSAKVKPDVAIVVFGEDPYAEYQGDRANLDFEGESGLALLKKFRAAGVPTVAVFLSGRPLWVNPELNASDAFVAAWLPGSEGEGVADVLLGKPGGGINYDFSGRLSFSWPKLATQSPLNSGDPDYDPLFPYGYGLTYAEKHAALGALSEESGLIQSGEFAAQAFMLSGRARSPFELVLRDDKGGEMKAAEATAALGDTLSLKAVDRFAQEDTRLISWAGPATLSIEGPTVDLSEQAANDMVLTITYSVNERPTGPVRIGMACGADCQGFLDVSQGFNLAASKGWRDASIALSCFSRAGVDLSRVTAPFIIEGSKGLALQVSDIRLTTNAGNASCDF